MVGIPNRIPKYITVGFRSSADQEFSQGIVVDAFDSDVPENIKQEYIAKYHEVANNGGQKDLSAVVKTSEGEYILIPVISLTTLMQAAGPKEAKQLSVEEELHKLYNSLNPEIVDSNGDSVAESIRKLLYGISLKNRI